jgi:cytochrome c oxidase cbb3-type subunit 4
MYKNILQSINGVEVYAIIALLIFFLFFVGVTIWLLKVDKNYLKKMSKLPLESDNNEASNLTGETYEG